MPEHSVVGKRIPRVDALDKVTGKSLYSADIVLPQMLHGRVLRSPYPHANIHRIDVSRARSLEGVMAVITAADVPGKQDETRMGYSETPCLARKKVAFEGQPVAAVAAINADIAEAALSLIEVDYEELPPLLDVLDNMKKDATLIWPDLYTRGSSANDSKPSNISATTEIERGNVEAGFQEADLVMENTFRTQTVHQGYLEPQASVVSVDLSGKITVWSSSQGNFQTRDVLAEFLDLPLNRINVIPVEVGGAFGGKTYQILAPLAAILSIKTRRPVKMVMNREEVLKASRPAHASVIKIKMGVTSDGLLTAAQALIVYEEGAFGGIGPHMESGIHSLGMYRIPNLKVEVYSVLTNKVPSGAYRAPGATQATFAIESQMDMIAETLGMNPLQLRIKNAAVKGDIMPTNTPYPTIGFKETLEKMAEYEKGKKKPEGEKQGRGIACGIWLRGKGGCAANVKVNADSSVNLLIGSTDLTGTRTSLSQIVAEEFGIPFERVSVVTGDTETAPPAVPTVGSLVTISMGTAVYRACQDAKTQLAQLAASHLGVEPDNLEFVDGCVRVKGAPEKSIQLDVLARSSYRLRSEGPVIGRGSVGAGELTPMFAVHMADVEVDTETGKVKILSYTAAQDVGLAINPTLVEGQIQGAVAQGIGWGLTEGYIFDKGVMQNTTLLDYRMPTAVDIPFTDTLLVEVSSEAGPYGLRPVGEPPMVPVIATIANAIYSAAGVRLKELPMTPEAIFQALQDQGNSGQTRSD